MATLASATGSGTAPSSSTPPGPPSPPVANWRDTLGRRLVLSDTLTIAVVVFGTQLLWFGLGNVAVAIREDARITDLSYWVLSTLIVVLWSWALALSDSRSHRIVGSGATEYRRVVDASLRLFGFIAIFAFLLRIDVARGYLLVSLPAGLAALIIGRWCWRRWLLVQRQRGAYSAQVLLVGSRTSVEHIARELRRAAGTGLHVVGACVPEADECPGEIEGVPLFGTVEELESALALTGADTVAVTSTDDLPPEKVKRISWQLEAGRQHLVLAPSIMDIAGPRIHARPVAGLPLIHVETPRYSKGQLFLKRSLDIITAAWALLLLSPVLVVLAIIVAATSPGPVLFRQRRIGYRGHEFEMLKFRSMVVDAEAQLADLQHADRDTGNEVLFKMKDDPRVTRVGRVMRRFSLDELPQLFNVLAGSMSLVGPRPPLPREVEQYADHVHRRFLAKPGITGLWQVSGRSTLSWEDSVALDLSYVENWTLVGDLVILLRTARAVVNPGGTAH